MSVAADLPFGEAPLASPELALVDSTLAAELRRSLSPVVDAWLHPPARVEPDSVASEDASLRLDSTHDPEKQSRDAEEPDDPGPPWLDLEDGAHEGSTLHRPADVDEAPASEGGVPARTNGVSWTSVEKRCEATSRCSSTTTSSRRPSRRPQKRTSRHLTIRFSPPRTRRRHNRRCRRCLSTDPRAPNRGRRETLTQAQDSPPLHTCIGSRSGVRSRGAGG